MCKVTNHAKSGFLYLGCRKFTIEDGKYSKEFIKSSHCLVTIFKKIILFTFYFIQGKGCYSETESTRIFKCRSKKELSINLEKIKKVGPKVNSNEINENKKIKEDDQKIEEFSLLSWKGLMKKSKEYHQNLEEADVIYNQFSDVICPAKTAVSFKNSNDKTLYIHANHLSLPNSKFKFIASQVAIDWPLSYFVAIEQNKCSSIINLTKNTEGSNVVYRDTVIDKTKGQLTFKNSQNNERSIHYTHFNQWPDYGVISLEQLNDLVALVERQHSSDHPILVHCRAGVGRTGTLITAVLMKEYIENNIFSLSKDDLEQHLQWIIFHLRKQRGPLFVQTEEQYGLLREFSNEIWETENSYIIPE